MNKTIPRTARRVGSFEENVASARFASAESVDEASQLCATPPVATDEVDAGGESFFQSHALLSAERLPGRDPRSNLRSALEHVRQLAILLARQAAAEDDAAQRQRGTQ